MTGDLSTKPRRLEIYLKFAVGLVLSKALGSWGSVRLATLSSENDSSFKSRTWNLCRPLRTISIFRGRRLRWGDVLGTPMLPIPESLEISRWAWNSFFVLFANCFSCLASIAPLARRFTGTGTCGCGRLAECNVNFETAVAAFGAFGAVRTLSG